MGVNPLFCCFKKQNPLCVVITALVANVIAIFAFLLLIEGDIDLIAIIFLGDNQKNSKNTLDTNSAFSTLSIYSE